MSTTTSAPTSPAAPTTSPTTPSTTALWAGRVVGGVPALMLGMGGVMDIIQPEFVLEGLARAGYPLHVVLPLGIVTVISTLLYLIPRTSLLGALLLTGYLGGAVATHVRIDDPIYNLIPPVVFASLLWTGLLLTEPRLRPLLPLRNPA